MRIHTDHNGVYVNAITKTYDGEDVEGHVYGIGYGGRIDEVKFQTGPVQETGVNGITNEALLAILIHRTKYLDDKLACDENKRAIQHMEDALVNLEARTARRIALGVEGQESA